MREHIYREADTNRDGLISKKEFLDYTSRLDFERDEVVCIYWIAYVCFDV